MSDHPIYRRRKILGYTQEALAAEAHLDVRTVRRAESGENVSAETLKAIAAALSLDVAEIAPPIPAAQTAPQADDGGGGRSLLAEILEAAHQGLMGAVSYAEFRLAPEVAALRTLPVVRSGKTSDRVDLLEAAQIQLRQDPRIKILVLPDLHRKYDVIWLIALFTGLGLLAILHWLPIAHAIPAPELEPQNLIAAFGNIIVQVMHAVIGLLPYMILFGVIPISLGVILSPQNALSPGVVYGLGDDICHILDFTSGTPSSHVIVLGCDEHEAVTLIPEGDTITCRFETSRSRRTLRGMPRDTRVVEILEQMQRACDGGRAPGEERALAA
jgi:transcriptional regulator with XRE-family HTH domain